MRYVQIQYVVDDSALGGSIAEALLADRLVACCQQVGPITSRYWWKGDVESASEWLFLCKTVGDKVPSIIEAITRLHPYETPEIIATEITDGLDSYLGWVEAETSQ